MAEIVVVTVISDGLVTVILVTKIMVIGGFVFSSTKLAAIII